LVVVGTWQLATDNFTSALLRIYDDFKLSISLILNETKDRDNNKKNNNDPNKQRSGITWITNYQNPTQQDVPSRTTTTRTGTTIVTMFTSD
jgi:hypothetical protein